MTTKGRPDIYSAIERLFRDAVLTLANSPNTGCKPAGYKSCMPEVVRGWWDDGVHTDEGKRERNRVIRAASRSAISRLDYALMLMSGADLTAKQRELIWGRAKRVPWKILAFEVGMKLRTAKRQYGFALAEICAYDVARKRKAVAHKLYYGHARSLVA